ncbi:rhodopsin, G0-coupled [Strongylocentrotus purpuratus]|uniref:G-protein coupled receptors family 1 profile domain-containing protein n=1 Tax=Strongylocentrotus purpuratus TaxID=7668 RepID=A0A7M7RAN3_STRPU|nr:rhodopsin, G0-coupled [Strongylocentrotus purpuratus]
MNSFSEESYVTDPTTTQPTLFLTPLSQTGYLLTALYLTLVGIVSTIGNITVLCVLCRYGTFRKRSVNILLMNMAVSDLGVSVAGYPLTAISGYRGRWVFADIGCQFSGFCVYALSCSTISTHAVVAIYRYIYIVKPYHRPRLSSSTSCLAILCIWTFTLFWTITPFFGWSSYTYEPFGTSCSINWYGKSLGDLTYIICCVVFVFIIPIIIMLYCYIGVAKKIKGIDPLRTEERDIAVVFGRLRKHETKIDTRVTKICFMMMASFIVVWTPYAVGSIWASKIGKISASASVLPTMFAKSSCMINPIIFLTSSSKFRADLGKLWNRPSSPEHTIRVEERSREQRSFFVRQSALPDAMVSRSASVYYDKERIYIGEMRAASIQKEADLLHRDPEAISIASSTSSSLQFVLKDRQNRYKKKAGEASKKGSNILHFPYDDTEGSMINNLMRPRSHSVTSDNISRVFAPSLKRPTKKRSMSHPDIPSTSADIFTVSPTTIKNLQKQ